MFVEETVELGHDLTGNLIQAHGVDTQIVLRTRHLEIVEERRLQRTVFVIGIESRKLVQMLSLGAHILTREGDDFLAQADVVIALGHWPRELKFVREHALQEVDTLLVEVGDAERLVMGKTLVAQGTDGAFQATVARLG